MSLHAPCRPRGVRYTSPRHFLVALLSSKHAILLLFLPSTLTHSIARRRADLRLVLPVLRSHNSKLMSPRGGFRPTTVASTRIHSHLHAGSSISRIYRKITRGQAYGSPCKKVHGIVEVNAGPRSRLAVSERKGICVSLSTVRPIVNCQSGRDIVYTRGPVLRFRESKETTIKPLEIGRKEKGQTACFFFILREDGEE